MTRGEDCQIVAPPPPGFVDDTNQYYQEDQGEDDRGSGKLCQIFKRLILGSLYSKFLLIHVMFSRVS